MPEGSLSFPLTPAASALIVHGETILLVRSTRTQQQWAFPGGRSEEDESARETAVREAREEVGLSINVTHELGLYVIEYAKGGFEITCFVATAEGKDLRIDAGEILEAKWCTLQEALHLNLVSTVREALLTYAGLSE